MAKAMILAAGQGTRLHPLTQDRPKPMVPLLGRPLMEYLVEHLARHGIREIMVNVAFHHERIEEYFGDGSRWDVEIGYAYEGTREHGKVIPRPQGSAGGMRSIQDFGGFFDQSTLVLCGDALIDLDIAAALAQHRGQGAIASVIAQEVPAADVQAYGIIGSDGHGRIHSFQEKPAPGMAHSTLASTGIYIFEPTALRSVPRGTFYDIGSQLFQRLVAQRLPFYVQNRVFSWLDVGRLSDYWSVAQRALNGEIAGMPMPGRQVRPGIWVGLNTNIAWESVHFSGPIYIGSNVRIEPGATIEGPTWIGHGCVVCAGARITRSIVFEYTSIPTGVHVHDMVLSRTYGFDRRGIAVCPDSNPTTLRWGDSRGQEVERWDQTTPRREQAMSA